ncbi:THUMP-like domain-containing protein [Winogradskyella sp. Asnod2-B02-A]|uniref:THUMP-like domain-containing protein n=1 Tax=Winogradskyella sp. Asnod2-B02-A TaxID=3160583 RepID=UPI00386B79D1
MNKDLLHIEIQEFITNNLDSNTAELLLKGIPFKHVDSKLIIEQIEAKKRSQKKLPTWYSTKNIYFPNKLNIEQTSSEITAKYKSNLISGNNIIDLTGGLGVDTFYFSKQIKSVIHCEINAELSELVIHNFEALQVTNVTNVNENGIDVLKRLDQPFDWIYIDPSRRDDLKQKVFLLADCEPNIKTHQDVLLKYAKNVMIKTSPLLDLTATLSDLKNVKQIHIVAVNNEVKELLWILERDFEGEVEVNSVNLKKNNSQHFRFKFNEEPEAVANYSKPLTYLYEPNSAVLKSGGFNSISDILNINKLHKHSHLYTSEIIVDFPGRQFKIEKILPYNRKAFSKEKITKANVTTRNFPLSVNDIRKKLKIRDGGNIYLFFTTSVNEEKIILICSKLN